MEQKDFQLGTTISITMPYGPDDIIHDSHSGWTFKIIEVYMEGATAHRLSSNPNENNITHTLVGKALVTIVDSPDKDIIGHLKTMTYSLDHEINSKYWSILELGPRE